MSSKNSNKKNEVGYIEKIQGVVPLGYLYEFDALTVLSISVEFTDTISGERFNEDLDMPSPDWEADSQAKSMDAEPTIIELPNGNEATFIVSSTQLYGSIYLDEGDIQDLTIFMHTADDLAPDVPFEKVYVSQAFNDIDDVDDTYDPELKLPFSPPKNDTPEKIYNIDSYTNAIPIERLVQDFKDNKFIIPPFQRSFVWDQRQLRGLNRPSMFIDSLLLGLPISPITIYRERNERDGGIIIDGIQRLSTLQYYIDGKFPSGKVFKLMGEQLQSPKRYHNKTFSELGKEDQENFLRIFMAVTFLRQLSPDEKESASSMHLVFQRLNTGGMTLTPHEIRSVLAIKNEELSQFLDQVYTMPEWKIIFGLKADEKQNLVREYIFRAYIFAKKFNEYKKPFQKFLDNHMENFKPDEQDFDYIKKTVEILSNMKKQKPELFCPLTQTGRRGKHNVGLFDAIFSAIFYLCQNKKTLIQEQFINRYDQYVEGEHYKTDVGRGSVDASEIKKRIQNAINIFSN